MVCHCSGYKIILAIDFNLFNIMNIIHPEKGLLWGASGSILGPLFFLLYINDICNVSQLIDIVVFADDTNIFFFHKESQYVINTLNRETEKLSDWFHANKLSLNVKFMVFKPRKKNISFGYSIVLKQ